MLIDLVCESAAAGGRQEIALHGFVSLTLISSGVYGVLRSDVSVRTDLKAAEVTVVFHFWRRSPMQLTAIPSSSHPFFPSRSRMSGARNFAVSLAMTLYPACVG